MKYQFTPGLELNRKFYKNVVGPLMKKEFPKLKYAAAFTGNGSDVLGFDDPTSMDHNWGPKMRLILPKKDYSKIRKKVDKMLREKLPPTFMGYPTNFTQEAEGYLKQQMKLKTKGEINHLIRLYSIESFFRHYIAFDPSKEEATVADWLTFPEQSLLEVSAGEIFHDTLGFSKYQKKLQYYPKEIWHYIMRVQWGRVGDELGHHARSGQSGDELGSRVLAARMVRRIIKLSFLIEGKYAPYSKWVGRAFSHLAIAKKLEPLLLEILQQPKWMKRQIAITKAHVLLAKQHNKNKITKPIAVKTDNFHGRNYLVFNVVPVMQALDSTIRDPRIKNLRHKIGAIDQFMDHAKINHEEYIYRKLKFLFEDYAE